jgi:hypothetical protein
MRIIISRQICDESIEYLMKLKVQVTLYLSGWSWFCWSSLF